MDKEIDTSRSLRLEEDLKSAIDRGQFELHYQPKIVLHNGKLKGFEALLRWNHPEFGRVPPSEFIPIAEASGMISKLGFWVAKTAIHQLGEWRVRRVVSPAITMAVNVSSHQLHDPDILDCIKQQMSQSNVPASCVTLEITESALIDPTETIQTLLDKIVQEGIGLDLDDFGTGYSCLSYLHRLPFRSIKIDHSFIHRITEEPKSLKIVASIIELAKAMDMGVVAEGVETAEQEAHLKRLGCDVVQGYRYSRPLSVVDVERYLQPVSATARLLRVFKSITTRSTLLRRAEVRGAHR